MTKHSTLDPLGLGYASAFLSALSMLLLGILPRLGFYKGAAEMMMGWHMFFGMTATGIITGIIEAAVIGFLGGYVFGWAYNKFSQ